jgi:hypothetical protein
MGVNVIDKVPVIVSIGEGYLEDIANMLREGDFDNREAKSFIKSLNDFVSCVGFYRVSQNDLREQRNIYNLEKLSSVKFDNLCEGDCFRLNFDLVYPLKEENFGKTFRELRLIRSADLEDNVFALFEEVPQKKKFLRNTPSEYFLKGVEFYRDCLNVRMRQSSEFVLSKLGLRNLDNSGYKFEEGKVIKIS